MNLNPVLMKFLFFIATLFVSNVYGQQKFAEAMIPDSIKWSEGSIVLNDGTQLNGLVRYNDKTGILYYQQGEDSKLFLSRNVFSFSFLDLTKRKPTQFYSLSYEDPTGILTPYFFEVLFEFEKFSVISKIDLPTINVISTYSNSPNGTMTKKTGEYYGGFSIKETIYIMDSKGKIEPLVQVIDTEYDRNDANDSKTKSKILNKRLLNIYTQPYHDKLMSFVNERGLSLKNKSHLLIIFEYYSELLSHE
jgi:hypothetical protein